MDKEGHFLPIAATFAPLSANLIRKILRRRKKKRGAKKQIQIKYPKIKFTKNNRCR